MTKNFGVKEIDCVARIVHYFLFKHYSVLGYCNNGVTSLQSVQIFSVDNGTS